MSKHFTKFRTFLLFSFFTFPLFLNAQSYQYLHFDKVNDFVLLDNGGQFIPDTDEMSMTGWFYCDQLSYGQGYMGFRIGSGDGEFYLIQLNNGVMECRLKSTTGLHQYVSPENTAVAQEWQHFAWVYDGSSVILYVNGVEIGSTVASGTFSSSTVPFGIGISNLPGFNFVFGGGIDEVSVWDKGLTQSEVQDVMSIGLDGNENNLQLYYKFNQGIPEGDNTSISELECEIGGGARDADLNNFALTGASSNFLGQSINPEFTSTATTICLNDQITFTDLTPEEITDWNWTFEGGDPGSSTDENPTVTYNSTGTFDVSMFVYDGENYTTLVMEDYITVLTTPGDASIITGSVTNCQNTEYEYSVGEIEYATEYEWIVEPENAGSFSLNQAVTGFTTSDTFSGAYTITVRGVNGCGEGAWSAVLDCEILETPTVFDLSGDNEYCEGDLGVELSLSSSETDVDYELYLDGMATGIIVGGNGSAFTFDPVIEEGTYSCIASLGSCVMSMNFEISIEMNSLPEQGSMPQGITELCSDTSTSYITDLIAGADDIFWNLAPPAAGSLSSDGINASIDWEESFNGTAFLTVYGENNCGAGAESFAIVISVSALPSPEISGLIEVCDEEEASYETDENSGNSYNWEVDGGSITSGAGTNVVTVLWGSSGIGLLSVTEENSLGCSDTTEDFEVTINDCTTIDEINYNDIRIYPVPSNGLLNVEGNVIIESLSVYSSNGQLISSHDSQSTDLEIDVSTLEIGLYIVRIKTVSGIFSRSLIVE